MTQTPGEPGLELVLDNRKLIIGFILLMVVCAAFFLFGFVEGKRQAMEARNQGTPAQASLPGAAPPVGQQGTTGASGAESKPIEARPVREQLDWYQKVGNKSDHEAKQTPKTVSADKTKSAVKKTPETRGAAITPPPPASAGPKVSYSVQVGAFKDRRQAELKGAALKAKRYEYVISPTTNGLYGIKVGSFESRADAVALQNRLRKDGFQTIIKTN